MRRFILAAIPIVMLLIAAYEGVSYLSFTFTPAKPGSKESFDILVQKGQTSNDLIKVLVSNGIVTDGRKLFWLGRVFRQWGRVKAGEYRLSPAMTPMQIFSAITSGISVHHQITIREGENMYEIAENLEELGLASKERFVKLCRDPDFIASLGFRKPLPPSLEGYLFPDTYLLNRTQNPEEMIRQMLKRFKAEWGSSQQKRAEELGLSEYQVITLASMIEKETGAPQERPMISSVFYNRLHKKMRLQSDPTTIYGMWESFDGNIHRNDLLAQNPYNTYFVPALPVGPIANPGKEAIHAALFPAKTTYLFFVSKNDGTHEFTENFKDHQTAVQRFQLDARARAGKSWRDLKRTPLTGSSTSPRGR